MVDLYQLRAFPCLGIRAGRARGGRGGTAQHSTALRGTGRRGNRNRVVLPLGIINPSPPEHQNISSALEPRGVREGIVLPCFELTSSAGTVWGTTI